MGQCPVNRGANNAATNYESSVSGGFGNSASGNESSILGGLNVTMTTPYVHSP